MTLAQLRLWLDRVIAEGADPAMGVCIADEDGEVVEVDDLRLFVGRYHADPSPKMGGNPCVTGPFLMVRSGRIDYEAEGSLSQVDIPDPPDAYYDLEGARSERVWSQVG